jgi:hypothetical protein
LIITIDWKILISMDSGDCGLNIGFLLIEGIKAFDRLKEMEML